MEVIRRVPSDTFEMPLAAAEPTTQSLAPAVTTAPQQEGELLDWEAIEHELSRMLLDYYDRQRRAASHDAIWVSKQNLK